MRTIKFRVFANGKMRYPNTNEITFSNASFYKVNMSDESIDIENVAKMELMQFTGLHDKNGKEIYEGDIVECKKITNKFSYKFTSIVIMQYGCFGVVTNRFITLKDLIEGKIKIIGNINENPELL